MLPPSFSSSDFSANLAADPFEREAILPLDREPTNRLWRTGAGLSILAHVGLAAFLFLWPASLPPLPEPPPEKPVEMVFDGAAAGAGAGTPRAAQKAETPAPPAPAETKAPPNPTPPTPKPPEPPPPVPPPPRPVEAARQPAHTHAKTPVHQRAEIHEKGEVAPKPKPKPKQEPKPAKHQAQVKAAEKHVDKPPEKPQASHTTQAHESKNTQADSHSLLATLDSFRSDQKQSRPASAAANPQAGGSPKGGGSPDGDTRALSSGEQKAIGGSVRRCYEEDTAAKNYASFVARMVVTVDSNGEARLVTFAPQTAARMASDPSYRVLAERARAAVLSPTCAHLPVPKRLLGQTRQFRFVFRP